MLLLLLNQNAFYSWINKDASVLKMHFRFSKETVYYEYVGATWGS